MTDSERIQEIIKSKNLSNIQFCNRTGVNPASLSHIMSGRSNPTLSILRSVVSGFPDLNPEWVLMGTGPMLRVDVPVTTDSGDADSGVDNVAQSETPNSSSVSILSNSSPRHDALVTDPKKGINQVATPVGINTEEVVRETIAQMENRPKRKVVEIRVFYDDGTYESFGGNR